MKPDSLLRHSRDYSSRQFEYGARVSLLRSTRSTKPQTRREASLRRSPHIDFHSDRQLRTERTQSRRRSHQCTLNQENKPGQGGNSDLPLIPRYGRSPLSPAMSRARVVLRLTQNLNVLMDNYPTGYLLPRGAGSRYGDDRARARSLHRRFLSPSALSCGAYTQLDLLWFRCVILFLSDKCRSSVCYCSYRFLALLGSPSKPTVWAQAPAANHRHDSN